MAELAALRSKTYSYLIDNGDKNKKSRDTKRHSIKQKLKFEDYKHCLEATQFENKIDQLQKNKLI